jgi:hypothetical protein
MQAFPLALFCSQESFGLSTKLILTNYCTTTTNKRFFYSTRVLLFV